MKKKHHFNISFKWFDFWIGFFYDVKPKTLYICLLPMVVIKLWFTEHEVCPECGSLMYKTAYDVAPEGFDLYWNCEDCQGRGGESRKDIDFNMDFKWSDGWISRKDLERFGYQVF